MQRDADTLNSHEPLKSPLSQNDVEIEVLPLFVPRGPLQKAQNMISQHLTLPSQRPTTEEELQQLTLQTAQMHLATTQDGQQLALNSPTEQQLLPYHTYVAPPEQNLKKQSDIQLSHKQKRWYKSCEINALIKSQAVLSPSPLKIGSVMSTTASCKSAIRHLIWSTMDSKNILRGKFYA